MRHLPAAASLIFIPGLHADKRQPARCFSARPAALHHQRGLLRCGEHSAVASFSLFCTQRTPQVCVHLGGRSVCCCTAIGGSFAPQFISRKLGEAADTAVADVSTAATASSVQSSGTDTRIEAVWTLQSLFAAHDSLYFDACNNRKEYLIQGCGVCFIGLQPFGEEPAMVLHADKSAPSAPSTKETSAAAEGGFASCHVVGWPLGAPESFRRQVEAGRLTRQAQDEALSKALGSKLPPAPFTPQASSLPDFAIQPLHDDVMAVVWGTPSFWEALPPDFVCSLVAEFLLTQKSEDEDSLLSSQVGGVRELDTGIQTSTLYASACTTPLPHARCAQITDLLLMQEEASEFLLRKAVVQAVINKEKTVKELLYHPAALHAAGLPHWKDPAIEVERRAGLGNRKAEAAVMRRVVQSQEEFLSKNRLLSSVSSQPLVDSDIGVLVLLLQTSNEFGGLSALE
ncbi:hypothetical protein Efla_001852 [Eimeria flavescens]